MSNGRAEQILGALIAELESRRQGSLGVTRFRAASPDNWRSSRSNDREAYSFRLKQNQAIPTPGRAIVFEVDADRADHMDARELASMMAVYIDEYLGKYNNLPEREDNQEWRREIIEI